ncbi:MAG: SpoIID/LytB domain-containing protein [Lawsonibacter sp.]|nr:SpoIID/LytB domain-containing protein [Lawsonibacter sp.]
MTKRFMQLAASILAMALCFPPALAANSNSSGNAIIRVGLASSSDHNDTGELACAHLQNNSGYGCGFRFGYYDDALNFVELGRTSKSISEVAVLKTQNMYYGYDTTTGKNTYSDTISSNIAVGCYHIQIPGSYSSYEDAAADAAIYGGFVAWINGAYQVRVGAYQSKSGAEGALATMPQGTIVGTSSYGMSVVKTGTDQILFQYDNGSSQAFGILPDVTGASDVRTWFLGYKYRGGFTYQRISANNLTVVNVLGLEDYIKGVVCYEMGREWPLEALKTQATCARTYVLKRLGYHGSLGFDVCNSDSCQVYRGVGSNRTDYGPSAVSDQAVEETSGQVIWYQNNLADTYYSSSTGGASESAYNVWGTDITKYPYLCGVIDPYEPTIANLNSYSSWTVTYTSAGLTSRLQSYGYGTSTALDRLELTYSALGNVIQVKICYANGQSNTITPRTKPRAIRALFGVNSIRFTINGQTANAGSTSSESGYTVNGSGALSGLDGLYTISGTGTTALIGSAPYIIDGTGNTSALGKTSGTTSGTNEGGGAVTVSGSSYVFQGSGWGHQVGMSQYGANAMARLGYTYDEICEFYFPGTEVGAHY